MADAYDFFQTNVSLFSTILSAFFFGNYRYTKTSEDAANPLAWPLKASIKQLKGFPPTMISVNELDPLRDEGLEMYRKLVAAGVNAQAKIIAGTTHGIDRFFGLGIGRPHLSSIHVTMANSIKSFAAQVAFDKNVAMCEIVSKERKCLKQIEL